MLSASKLDRQKELKALNYTLQEKRDEFEAITADIKQANRDLEEISGYLLRAEQNKAQEIANRWNDWEYDFTH